MKKYLLILSFVLSITCIAQPTISSFSPSSGPVGTSAVISGSGFSTTASANTVYFGAVKATVTAATSTSLTVTAPTGSSYQPISVLVNKLIAYSTKPFKITFSGNGVSLNTTSFIRTKNISSGASPRSVRSVDFDGDGKADLVSSNQSGGTLGVFRNISTSATDSFAAKTELITGTGAYKICIGDLNGDGKPDMVVSNFNSGNAGSISIFRNASTSGNISFGPKIDSAIGNGPLGLAIADLDGDGKPEVLVAAGNSGYISVFKNTSANDSISFAAKINVSNSGHADNILVRDIDGDGKPDLVASNFSSGSISVYRNTSTTGNISFAAKVDFTVGTNPGDIVCGDLDGDGVVDIAVSNYSSTSISILRNTSTTGNISFSAKTDLITGSNPMELALEDLDGDGKTDISVVNNSSNTFSVFKNTGSSGTISFAAKIDFTTELAPTGICIADLNGDGKPDIATTNSSSGTFSLFRNKLSEPKISSFSPTYATISDTVTINGINLTGVSSVSFGGTAAASFIISNDSTLKAVLGNGSTGIVKVSSPYGTDSLLTLRYNIPVIDSVTPLSAISGSTITITGKNFSSAAGDNVVYFGAVKAKIIGGGGKIIKVEVPKNASYGPVSVTTKEGLTAFDYKNFTTLFSNKDSLFKSGSFGGKLNQTGFSNPGPVYVKDVDGDGKPDYIVLNKLSYTLAIMRNSGQADTSMFTGRIEYATEKAPHDVLSADFDGDGKPDIIVVNDYVVDNAIQYLSVYRNTGTGPGNISFTPKSSYVTGISASSWSGYLRIRIADLDGDGKPDLAVGTNGDTISVFRNTSTLGNISFASRVTFKTIFASENFFLSDLNGDGKADLIMGGNFDSEVSVFRNKSELGQIAFDTRISVPISTSNSGPLVVTDLDLDGKNDIAILQTDKNFVSVLRNTSTSSAISFASEVKFATGAKAYRIIANDLNGDGKPELVVLNHNDAITIDSMSIYRNTGTNGVISYASRIIYSLDQLIDGNITANDLDGDSRADLLISYNKNGLFATAGNGVVSMLRNLMNAPVLISMFPDSGNAGDTIVLRGNSLTSVTNVSFGGTPAAAFTVNNDSTITTVLGSGSTGFVKIITPNGSDSLGLFKYNIPVIDSLSPSSGAIGSTIIIKGKNFSTTAADNLVYFGPVKAAVTSATASQLTVAVPIGAIYKPVSVTVRNLTASSKDLFTVTFPNKNNGFFANSFIIQNSDSLKSSVSYERICSSDLDGDGRPDLVGIVGTSATVAVLRNTGTGTNAAFTLSKELTSGLTPTKVTIADIDGDGKPDIITSNKDENTVSLFRNTSTSGNISFESKKDFTIGSDNGIFPNVGFTNVVAVGDFNNDGKPDIVAAAGNSSIFSVLLNATTGNNIVFLPKIDFGSAASDIRLYGAREIAVADLNKDGKVDIVFSNGDTKAISIFQNTTEKGVTSFGRVLHYLVGEGSPGMAVGDLNKDGLLDIAVSNDFSRKTLSFLKNTSTKDSIKFAEETGRYTTNSSRELLIDNFSGTGKPDIAIDNIISGYDLSFRNNIITNGPFSFAPSAVFKGTNGPLSIATGDFNMDGKPDVAGSASGAIILFLNKIDELPHITSFDPGTAGYGSTITIKGNNFTNVTSVKFANTAALSFKVVSDTVITANVGKAGFGYVYVSNAKGADSVIGFQFYSPEITIVAPNNLLSFTGVNGGLSKPQSYRVYGKYLSDTLLEAKASADFLVSRNADTGFTKSVKMVPVLGTVDTTVIFVRFKGEPTFGNYKDSIRHYSIGAEVKYVPLVSKLCDSTVLFTPVINNYSVDSFVCFKDSLVLGITNGSNFNFYRWSTGDTTQKITVKNSSSITVKVALQDGCYSNVSTTLKTIFNTNPIPVLGLTNSDTVLVSSNAPNYRWYYNNNIVSSNSSNSLVVKKTGFYSVETSNDKVCWDRSNDYPILSLATPLINDSVSVKSYPNPTSTGLFYIVATLQRATNVVAKVTVSDISGNILLQTNKFIFFGREIKIPVTLSVKGTVFAKIDINGDVKTQTVILQ